MALGNTFNNGNKNGFANGGYNNQGYKTRTQPTVYSQYKLINPDSVIDPSMVQFSYWSGLLKIQICPKIPSAAGDTSMSFDTKAGAIAIHLSIPRAQILKDEIEGYLANPGTRDNAGVATKKGYIYISNGKEFGHPGHDCLVIKLTDEETGKVASTIAYEFKKQYHYGIRNLDEEKRTYDSIMDPYDNLEVNELLIVLDQYIKGAAAGYAAATRDALQYPFALLQGAVSAIARHHGIDIDKTNPMGTSAREAYFSSNNSRTTVDSKASVSSYDADAYQDALDLG